MQKPSIKLFSKLIGFEHAAPNNVLMSSAFLMVLAFEICTAIISAYDSDIWFILASGKETLSNGIPFVNPSSAYDVELSIIVQQWLYGAFAFLLYDSFGTCGLYAGTTVLVLLFVFACFQLVKEIRQTATAAEIVLACALVCFPGLSIYITMRPHILTMALYVLIILLCEKGRRTGNWLYIAPIPLVVAFHVNIHMSMAVLDPFIVSWYIILAFFDGKAKGKGLLIAACAAIASFLALLVNPYGIDGALYVVKSYGYASYKNAIVEMSPLSFSSPFEVFIAVFGLLYLGCLALCARKDGLRQVLLNPLNWFTAAFLVLTVMNLRNEWVFFLFAFLSLASVIPRDKGIAFKKPISPEAKKIATVSASIIAPVLLVASFALHCTSTETEDGVSMPVDAVRHIDSKRSPSDEVKVACSFISGGFLEFHGMKVTIDARPEIWQPKITGVDQNLYYNYIDAVLCEDEDEYTAYFESLGCDYVLITYESNWIPDGIFDRSELYEKAVSGNGYDLYERK